MNVLKDFTKKVNALFVACLMVAGFMLPMSAANANEMQALSPRLFQIQMASNEYSVLGVKSDGKAEIQRRDFFDNNQSWSFDNSSEGVLIKHANTGYYLAWTPNDDNIYEVSLVSDKNHKGAAWNVQCSEGMPTCYYENREGMFLDTLHGSTSPNTEVMVWKRNGAISQNWTFFGV